MAPTTTTRPTTSARPSAVPSEAWAAVRQLERDLELAKISQLSCCSAVRSTLLVAEAERIEREAFRIRVVYGIRPEISPLQTPASTRPSSPAPSSLSL